MCCLGGRIVAGQTSATDTTYDRYCDTEHHDHGEQQILVSPHMVDCCDQLRDRDIVR